MAAAFNVPLVAVFGPTDWKTTSPFRVDAQLVRQPVSCALPVAGMSHRSSLHDRRDGGAGTGGGVTTPAACRPVPAEPAPSVVPVLSPTSLAGVTVFWIVTAP